MAENKIKFTVWLSPEILRAAKARAALEGTTASEVLAAAGKTVLINSDQEHTDAKVLAAVERVFALIQRIDRRRSFDQQVLKEMVGLMVQSFFNHTPGIPEKDKKAALHSGKMRFNRFLDTLAANLRTGQSIMNDLPVPIEPALPEIATPMLDSNSADAPKPAPLAIPETKPPPTVADQSTPRGERERSNETRQEKPAATGTRSRWNLFG
jgi:hypothetical protein